MPQTLLHSVAELGWNSSGGGARLPQPSTYARTSARKANINALCALENPGQKPIQSNQRNNLPHWQGARNRKKNNNNNHHGMASMVMGHEVEQLLVGTSFI